ncbi:MAG: phospho-N-acetylmuramoyl-pentapeptide-transferase, partial [Oscillospiraceae bacterium]
MLTNIIGCAAAFLITWLAGFWVIPLLHKLKYGQTILDIGPKWHKAKKEGTPTMGGVMFIIAVALSLTVGLAVMQANGSADWLGGDKAQFVKVVAGAVMAVLFGFMGFLDDFIKVSKKHNEGLTPIQKIIFQVMIIAAYFATLYISGISNTIISFPGGLTWDMGLFYYPVVGIGIVYLVNAVNLTDGIDGLCSSVTVVYTAVFAVIAGIMSMSGFSLPDVRHAHLLPVDRLLHARF